MNQQLINLAIQEVPGVIALLRGALKKSVPSAPEPTEAEVMAAFNAAFFSSLAKDDQWLASHPPNG